MTARPDAFDLAIRSGAIAALRKHAESIRRRAASGVTVLDRNPVVVIRTSEAAHSYRIARDLDQIARDLEGGAP